MIHIKIYEEYKYIQNNIKEFVDFLLDFTKEKSGLKFSCPDLFIRHDKQYKFVYQKDIGLPNYLFTIEDFDYESGEDDRYFSFKLRPDLMKIRKYQKYYGEHFESLEIIVLGLFIYNIVNKYVSYQNMIPQSSISEIKNELLKTDYKAFSKKEIQNLVDEEEILKASRDFNL